MDEKQLIVRKQGIGSSDAPAVVGVSEWVSPYQVWLNKTGDGGETPDNEPMYWGRALEQPIRQRYADERGVTVTVPPVMFSEEYPFMLASLDGMTSDNRIVEIKTARSPAEWGEDGSDEIPVAYMVQVQHQLVVAKVKVADIPVLFGGQDFRIYTVEADKELQEMIIDKEAEFWEMVKSRTPPDPVTYSDMVQRFKKSVSVELVADKDALNFVEVLRSIKQYQKDLEAQEEEAKAYIMSFLKDADTLIDESGKKLITWRMTKGRKTFDSKALESEQPEVYAKYLREGKPSRRFLIKMKGE